MARISGNHSSPPRTPSVPQTTKSKKTSKAERPQSEAPPKRPDKAEAPPATEPPAYAEAKKMAVRHDLSSSVLRQRLHDSVAPQSSPSPSKQGAASSLQASLRQQSTAAPSLQASLRNAGLAFSSPANSPPATSSKQTALRQSAEPTSSPSANPFLSHIQSTAAKSAAASPQAQVAVTSPPVPDTPTPGPQPVPTPGPTPTPEATPSPPPYDWGMGDDKSPETVETLNDPNHVTDNKVDINDFTDLNGDGEVTFEDADLNRDGKIRAADGRELIEMRAPQEQAIIEGLPPEQREQYENLQNQVAGETRAEMALQEMLLDGRLLEESQSSDGRTLLDELNRLATADSVHTGLDQKQMVRDLIQEIDNPTAMAQRTSPTCAPTTAAIYLASTNPAEYARIATDLATSNYSTMPNGHPLTRQQLDPSDLRSQSLQLVDSAFMEYANGVENNYNGSTLEHNDRESGEVRESGGLYGSEFDYLFDAITNSDAQYIRANDDNRSETMSQIREATENGQMVPSAIKWSEGGHELLVTGVDDNYVTFINPWGNEQRMSAAEFEARLLNTHLP